MEETNDRTVSNRPLKEKKPMDPKTKKNLLTWLVIVAIVFGIAVLFQFAAQKFGDWIGMEPDLPDRYPYIGVIYVEGTIIENQTDSFGIPVGYQHQWTLDEINMLIEDDMNKGLIIFVDSPGGGVYESDELYLKLNEYKENTGRPVYSAMGSMAASGGYYISAAADKIVANRNTWTGSIGVTIGTFYDISKFLEKNGIDTITITSGANKAMGSMTEPMSEEQKAIFQALVDECYDQFTGIVAEGRGMGIDKVKSIADGRIYTAKQALELGLIDAVGTKQDAIADMQENYELFDCDVIDITYVDKTIWGMLLNSFVPRTPPGDVSALLDLVSRGEGAPIQYMYDWQ